MVLKLIKRIKNIDKENFLAENRGRRKVSEHKHKKTRCRIDVKKFNYPSVIINTWIGLDAK